MTTTNGGRVVEQVDGVVQSANERGVHLVGEDDWRTYSKWAAKPVPAPAQGQRVRLALDGSGFVRSVEFVDEPSGSAGAGTVAAAVPWDRLSIRLRVVEIAAATVAQFAQTREDVGTQHIIPLADRLLAWVEQP